MKTIVSTLLFLSVCIPASRAAVQPIMLQLGSNATEYTIPVGKVLVIEHMMGANTSGNIILQREFNLDNGPIALTTLNMTITTSYTDGTLYTLERPLKITGGKLRRNLSPAGNTIYLIGTLVDQSDLFAAVPNTIESGEISAGVLATRIRPLSARPARAVVEKSADALTYTADSSATVTRTGSGAAPLTVTTSTDDAVKLIRVDLRARPSE